MADRLNDMQCDCWLAVTGLVVTDNADGAVRMIHAIIVVMQRGNREGKKQNADYEER